MLQVGGAEFFELFVLAEKGVGMVHFPGPVKVGKVEHDELVADFSGRQDVKDLLQAS